jgi:hypothetical protein
MGISEAAKKKALDFAISVYKQVNPQAKINEGSQIRGLLLFPFSLIYSSVFQELARVQTTHLGNFSSINEQDMDMLASDQLKTRPSGTRSTCVVEVYLRRAEPVDLQVIPYFESDRGVRFSPVDRMFFGVNDILEKDGELYINVPVISQTYGRESFARAGEIQRYNNFPADVVRVINPQDTEGGRPRQTNEEFFEFIQETQNATRDQAGGAIEFVTERYPEAASIEIVDTQHPRMIRDEVFTEDGTVPNLQRKGRPFASHTPLGVINFDAAAGRARSASGAFKSWMEGERIEVAGDIEKFRTISKVLSPHEAIITGHPLEGSSTGTVWGRGEKVKLMSDVYVHFPSIEVRSQVVDKRYRIQPSRNQINSNRLYYRIADGFGYATFPTSGRLVFGEGTVDEAIFDVVSVGSDSQGSYLQLGASFNFGVLPVDVLSFYDMSAISIAPGGDITTVPAMYILRVESLDPNSLEVLETIPRSAPGSFDEPGWYMSNTDPAQVFSAREDKSIILDEKRGKNAFREIRALEANIISPTHLSLIGQNTSQTEGRKVSFSLTNDTLGGVDVVEAQAARSVDKTEMEVVGLNARYLASDGALRSGFSVEFTGYNIAMFGGIAFSQTLGPDDVHIIGDRIIMNDPGVLFDPLDEALLYGVSVSFFNQPSLYNLRPDLAGTIESVVMYATPSEVEISLPLDYVMDKNGVVTKAAHILMSSREGTFSTRPVRVIYATHGAFRALQRESESNQLIDDTLFRSVYPSLLDMSIEYRGAATSEQLRSRFIALMDRAVRADINKNNIRVDLSNIISALDQEEGLIESVNVLPEVRVTNFLPDGEFEIRYLNPSLSTKQTMAIFSNTSPGDRRVNLRKPPSRPRPPGRGKLFLGGLDPDRQEVLPYEAVLENQDGSLTFVLRGGHTVAFSHSAWENAEVSTRDYDPELEFDGGIEIPSINRPYVRQLLVTKRV